MDAGQSLLGLDDTDIPGAHLDEPLEAHNIAALRWWLLCSRINIPTPMATADAIVIQRQSL